MVVINFILAHAPEILGSIVTVLSGVIGICLLIPGPHPEDWLQSAVDFLAKFSKKSG